MADPTNPVIGEAGKPEPAELRAQIAETRTELGNTIEALHGKLNPTVLKEQAIDQFHEASDKIKAELKVQFNEAKQALKHELQEAKTTIKADVRQATIGKVENMVHNAEGRVRDAGRSVADIVRQNPIPATLIGIGLAWIFTSTRRNRRRQQPQQLLREPDVTFYFDEGEPIDDPVIDDRIRPETGNGHGEKSGIRDAASRAAEKTKTAAGNAGKKVSDLAHQAGSKVRSAAHRVEDTAVDVAHGAADRARRVQHRVADYYEVNPVAVGAVALAVGTAIGLAIPRTKTEDEWLGSARDQMLDRAEQLAHEAMGAVSEKVDQVSEQMSEQPSEPRSEQPEHRNG